ncbi:MAG: hypothetical protein LBL55_09780, partial [Propionibacteriaceae bacterium]|nr:hypothetical protein [Propionibacteriaceae bacterium]
MTIAIHRSPSQRTGAAPALASASDAVGAAPDFRPTPLILLTPGPLTTSERTRAAATFDLGSWDAPFAALTAEVCDRLTAI